jgi:ETC complex I subunit conserved region
MTKARIFQPTKTAMQSGKAKTLKWKLEFAPEASTFTDPLMGWTGMTDMPREINLFFPTKEAAIAYAEKRKIPYEVFAPNPRKKVKKAYADNFKFDRRA